jgi:hypothetical protein
MANEVEIVVTSRDKSGPGFESASKAAKDYGENLEGVGEKADNSEQRILGAKDAVDGVATIMQGPGKQGIAAYLQGWADLASGVANFIIPSLSMLRWSNIRAAASTVGSTIAQKAAAAASKAWAAAQWVLNAALSANPIGLVVLAIAALVGAVILAWKHSDTFRRVVTAAFKAVGAAATWLWEKAIYPAFTAIRGLIGNVLRWFGDLPRNIVKLFAGANQWLLRKGRDIIDGLWDGLRGMWSRLWGWYRGIPHAAVSLFNRANYWLINKGKDILGGLWGGMKAIWSNVIGWFKDLPGKFLHAIGIKSPPQWAIDAGKHIMGGLLKGMAHGPDVKGFFRDKVMGAYDIWKGITAPAPAFAKNVGGYVRLGSDLAQQLFNWTGNQWNTLFQLWNNESGWNPFAKNPNSTAFGIPQFLASTAKAYGLPYGSTDAGSQIVAGLRYIKDAYGNPANAWAKWQSRSPHWYGSGGLITEPILGVGRSGQLYGFGERGPETVVPGTGGGRVVLEIRSGGSRLDDFLVELLRNSIRVRGGNVQAVLGR